MRKFTIILLCIFFFKNVSASEIENIINHFKKIENISFSFKQNINGKEEQGNCIIEYPKKNLLLI